MRVTARVVDSRETGGHNAAVSQKLRALTSSRLPRLRLPFAADALVIDLAVVQLAERLAARITRAGRAPFYRDVTTAAGRSEPR